MRHFSFFLLLVLIAFPASSERLFLLSKKDELSSELIKKYEKESGNIVVQTLYSNESEKNLFLSKAGGFSYDVIVTNHSALTKFVRSGIFTSDSLHYAVTSQGKWAFIYNRELIDRPGSWRDLFRSCISNDNANLSLPDDARIILLGIMDSLGIKHLDDYTFNQMINDVLYKCKFYINDNPSSISANDDFALIRYQDDDSFNVEKGIGISFPEKFNKWQFLAVGTEKNDKSLSNSFIRFLKANLTTGKAKLYELDVDFYDKPKNSKYESDLLSIMRSLN